MLYYTNIFKIVALFCSMSGGGDQRAQRRQNPHYFRQVAWSKCSRSLFSILHLNSIVNYDFL